MRVVNGFPSWCRLILTLVACAGSVGCTRNLVCKDALMALPKAQELVAHVPDVAIAVISQEGHVFPKRLIVRQNLHAIVWVANADSLTIRFPSGESQARVHRRGLRGDAADDGLGRRRLFLRGLGHEERGDERAGPAPRGRPLGLRGAAVGSPPQEADDQRRPPRAGAGGSGPRRRGRRRSRATRERAARRKRSRSSPRIYGLRPAVPSLSRPRKRPATSPACRVVDAARAQACRRGGRSGIGRGCPARKSATFSSDRQIARARVGALA